MSTNDSFEHDLRSLPRRSLPEAWRADILRAASTPPAAPSSPHVPRWLLAGWGLAWAAILVMSWTMPEEPLRTSTTPAAHARPPATMTAPFQWDQRAAAISDLLAAH